MWATTATPARWCCGTTASRGKATQSNYLHILARGDSHLPYGQPKFGTPCAANQPRTKTDGAAPKSMMGMEDGMMGEGEHPEDDHED